MISSVCINASTRASASPSDSNRWTYSSSMTPHAPAASEDARRETELQLALTLLLQDRPQEALPLLQAVSASTVFERAPATAKAVVVTALGDCLLRLGDAEQARERLQEGRGLLSGTRPADAAVVARMDALLEASERRIAWGN